MYSNETQILFPLSVIPSLTDLRGERWKALIERLIVLDDLSLEKIAFSLMMIRLNKCMRCQADSYRAMRGCVRCSQGTIRRFNGEDNELVTLFEGTRSEVFEDPKLGLIADTSSPDDFLTEEPKNSVD